MEISPESWYILTVYSIRQLVCRVLHMWRRVYNYHTHYPVKLTMLSLEDFHRCLHRHLGIAVMADERFAQEENHYKSIKQDQQPAHTNTHTHTEAKRMHCHLSHKVSFSLLIGCLSVNCKFAQLRCLAILEQKTDFLISFSFFFKRSYSFIMLFWCTCSLR